jgi:hypothetical protein
VCRVEVCLALLGGKEKGDEARAVSLAGGL